MIRMIRIILVVLAIGISASAHSVFTLPSTSCPVAHCSIFAGNQQPLAPPTPTPTINQKFDDAIQGRSLGLGCVSNNTFVACTYGTGPLLDGSNRYCPNGPVGADPKDTLVIYNATGAILYRSNCLFDGSAQSSVPLMNTNGDIIMTDATKIVRINYNPTTQTYPSAGGYSICMKTTTTTPVACTSSGTALDPLPGYPVSPILLNNGTMVVLATRAPGYVFAFWADDLTYIHRTPVTGLCTGGATCPYEARNTPAASYTAENRFYVSMNAYEASTLEEHSGYGQMIAFEANSITGTIDTKWSYSFAGPSGASPVVLPVAGGSKSDIYFDGFGNMDPRLIKVADDGGSSYTFRWQSTSGDFPNRIPASVTVDTGKGRSCVWAYSIARQLLKCVNLGNTYNVDNTIDVGSLVPASFPASVLTMTHPSTGGAVILLCVNFVGTNPGRILAIQVTGDYTTSNFSAAKYWDFALPQNGEYAPTQFPIVTDTTGPYSTLAFPTSQNRLYLYSNKP